MQQVHGVRLTHVHNLLINCVYARLGRGAVEWEWKGGEGGGGGGGVGRGSVERGRNEGEGIWGRGRH